MLLLCPSGTEHINNKDDLLFIQRKGMWVIFNFGFLFAEKKID
jgi:hypothetical protein